MITVTCGCGKHLHTIEDGKKEDRHVHGECSECSANGGDYSKSSQWREAWTEKTSGVRSAGQKPRTRSSR